MSIQQSEDHNLKTIYDEIEILANTLVYNGHFAIATKQQAIDCVIFSNHIFRLTPVCKECLIPASGEVDLDELCLQCRWRCSCDDEGAFEYYLDNKQVSWQEYRSANFKFKRNMIVVADKQCDYCKNEPRPPRSANFLHKLSNSHVSWTSNHEVTTICLNTSWDSIIQSCLDSITGS